eukprot:COSAG01_NODE_61389_length_289_cov_10.347368_2_plen_41_part_01
MMKIPNRSRNPKHKNMLQLINGIRVCIQTSDLKESDHKISK